MKNKIILGVLALFAIASSAYASVNGLYKGNPVVNVVVDGVKVESDVPGQIIDGSTLLPLRAVGEALGASIEWDASTYTATVTTAQTDVQEPEGLSLAELNRIGESVGIIYAYKGDELVSQGSGFVTQGTLITNYHVIDEGVTQIIAAFGWDEYTFDVSNALFVNEEVDLAGFTFTEVDGLELAESEPESDSIVFALGYPKNKFQISKGKAIGHDLNDLMHTAVIDSGSSGGVVVDGNGRVVGVTVAGDNGINAAVRLNHLKSELNKID